MQQHNLIQGTPSWHLYREQHFNASDAAAMMGCSPYKTRSELIRERATGATKDVDAGTQRLFDRGHKSEALARPLAEAIISEELYPVVGSLGKLSASFDGLNMMETIVFEHKLMGQRLRDAMHPGCDGRDLPLDYRVQMEQQLLVSGAEKCLFMASEWNGDELVEERHCWYEQDAKLRAAILAGWEQFEADVAAYVPEVVAAPVVAAAQMGLPTVAISVTGSIALVDNLDKFGIALNTYVNQINKKPETDQDFADLEATVKTLKAAEEALDAAEAGALAQTESIDTMRRTVAMYRDTARSNRLLVEKLVKAEKENRRNAIVNEATIELADHIANLNARIGKEYMPRAQSDFQGVIKGLKSLDSMKDKISTELARCKIEANATADQIQGNLKNELLQGREFMFADISTLCLKSAEDFQNTVAARIAAHEAAEAAKEAATRIRIRAEEQAAAEQAAFEKLERDEIARIAKLNSSMIQVVAPAVVESEPTLKLGDIGTRLGFGVTADLLASIGFTPAKIDRNSKLFHESEFPQICEALVAHIYEVADKFGVTA